MGDIGPKLQLDLLRVLEERKFHRLGGNTPVDVDVRIMAATNRDLAEGGRRRAASARTCSTGSTSSPSPSRRCGSAREDIPLLVEHFLERLSAEMKKPLEGVSSEAMNALLAHEWPGNVRELRNVLERGAVVVHRDHHPARRPRAARPRRAGSQDGAR